MTAHWISTCGCLAPSIPIFDGSMEMSEGLTCTFWWVHFGKHPHSCWSNLIFLVSTSNLGKFPTKTGRNQISLMSFVGEIHFFGWFGLGWTVQPPWKSFFDDFSDPRCSAWRQSKGAGLVAGRFCDVELFLVVKVSWGWILLVLNVGFNGV